MATKSKKRLSSAEIVDRLENIKKQKAALEAQLKEARKREEHEAAKRAAEDARLAGMALARAAFGSDGHGDVAKLAALAADGTLEALLAEALSGCAAWADALAGLAAGEGDAVEGDGAADDAGEPEASEGAAPRAQAAGWGM